MKESVLRFGEKKTGQPWFTYFIYWQVLNIF